ncbi:MAG: sulfatase [Saprospiraceae bacterium]|nr:sulfatase [Saprospiraceae bacterium]
MRIRSLLVAGALTISMLARGQDQPNIIWLVSEDNSKHFLEIYQSGGVFMESLASLAAEGLVYNHAFSQGPVCSVARSTLITGCYAPRIGAQYHRKEQIVPMPSGARMFPAYLRDAGYYTTNSHKEDYNLIKGDDVWDESAPKASYRNRQSGQPFFHVQNFGVTHEGRLHFSISEMDSIQNKTDPATVEVHAHHPDTKLFRYTYARYHDQHKKLDEQLMVFINQLKEDGVYDDAIIFYYGDHGGVLPGSKGYLYERGIHVPLIVRIPPKWQHLATGPVGSRIDGFVRFMDFGPTVLNLAGVPTPTHMDGQAFLGSNLNNEEVLQRNTCISYADRFDEKYDFVRGLRHGKFKYIRNYQPFNIDGLQNNYRYRMEAYEEWRALFQAQKLRAAHQQFFLPRPVEALYDIEVDPFELNNLAEDPKYASRVAAMRKSLQEQLQGLPDLSFIPEPIFIREGSKNPVSYGRAQQARIGHLQEIADLALLPPNEALPKLKKALKSSDPLAQYWALIACTSMPDGASALGKKINKLATRSRHTLVRMRALEYQGMHGQMDPQDLVHLLADCEDPITANMVLNTMVLLQDVQKKKFALHWDLVPPEWVENTRSNVTRRLEYLIGKRG